MVFQVPSFIPKSFKLCILTLSRFFSNFRRGTGLLSAADGSEYEYFFYMAAHGRGSLDKAVKAHATFGYEGSMKGKQVQLRPKGMFLTNKVSAVEEDYQLEYSESYTGNAHGEPTIEGY